MLALSTNSMKRLMECIKSQNNMIELINLRTCCFQLNEVAVQNHFYRMKLSTLHLILEQQPSAILRVYIGKLVVDILEERRIMFEKQTGNNEQFDSSAELEKVGLTIAKMNDVQADRSSFSDVPSTFQILIRKIHDRKLKTYKVGLSEKNIINVVNRAFTDAFLTFQKDRSVSKLILTGIKLDSQFLEMLKKHSSFLRELRAVQLSGCVIEWTSDELMTFLKLVDDLKELCISGKYREPILTDKHLSLVSQKIIIINEEHNIFDFPVITPKNCKEWVTKGMKRIWLNNISTELSFSSVSSLAEQLQLEDLPDEPKKVNFGALKCSDEDIREIVLAQRRQKTNWTIEKSITKNDVYKVSSIDDGYNYQFSIDRPYVTPDFANLLGIVRQIREDSETQEMNDDIWRRLNYRLCRVCEIMVDYRRRKNIPPAPVPPNLPINARGRAGLQAFANFYEEVILLRIRQLEEQEVQERANTN